jgi:hypothetical protein
MSTDNLGASDHAPPLPPNDPSKGLQPSVARDLEEKDYWDLTHQEDGLINHRLTWLLTGQPLLFLAYATASTARKGANESLLGEEFARSLLYWAPVAGFTMSLTVWVAMIGVCRAMWLLRRRRSAHTHAGVSDLTTFLGLVPAIIIPVVLALVWFALWPGNAARGDELRIVAWNVESGDPSAADPANGSDTETIAEQLQGLTEYDIVGLSEVRPL